MPIPQMQRHNWREQKSKNYTSHATPGVKRKTKWSRKLIGLFLLLFFFLIIVGGLVGTGVIIAFSLKLPDPNKMINRDIAQSTKIYDRTGNNTLYEVHGNANRTLVNFFSIL